MNSWKVSMRVLNHFWGKAARLILQQGSASCLFKKKGSVKLQAKKLLGNI